MILTEVDWDAQGGARDVPTDYPDAPIAAFVNWIRRTGAWQDDVELVHRRVRKLNNDLAEYRDRPKVSTAEHGTTTGQVKAVQAVLAHTTHEKRVAALAKARAAKVAKRALATA